MVFCRAASVPAAGGCPGGEAAGHGGCPGLSVRHAHRGGLPVLPQPLCQQPRSAGGSWAGAPGLVCARYCTALHTSPGWAQMFRAQALRSTSPAEHKSCGAQALRGTSPVSTFCCMHNFALKMQLGRCPEGLLHQICTRGHCYTPLVSYS